MDIDKLVEECARSIAELNCLDDGGGEDCLATCAVCDCRTVARAVIRRTLEFAAGRAKVAWLTTDCGTIGDAEYGEALCNELSEDLRSLSPKEQAP